MANLSLEMSRLDMKIDKETKLLAERAAAASGQSLSSYIYNLIRKDAPQILEEQQKIILTNLQYEEFIRACNIEATDDWPLSDKLIAVGRAMDQEGTKWR